MRRITSLVTLAVAAIIALSPAGCQNHPSQGLSVYFETPPNIYHSDVYWYGKVIGKIVDQQVGRGSVVKVTVQLDPQFEERFGTHWAFYADSGRLTAGQLSLQGDQLSPAGNICGFASKTAFRWFKLTTLLNDRVGKAVRRAGNLQRRFG